MKENSVESKIREVASKAIAGKYNLPQYKSENGKYHAEYLKVLKHKEICAKLVNFFDEHKEIPRYIILEIAVAKDAAKHQAFNDGYKHCELEKILPIYEMAKYYTQAVGEKGKPNDVCWRVVQKFYEKKSHDFDEFKAAVDLAISMSCALDSNRGHYAELKKFLGV